MLDYKKPILLVDLSSFIFYRAFAIYSWMSAAGINEAEFGQPAFIAKYSKMFKGKMLEYCKKLKVPYDNVILCKDCPRSQIWRMDVFADYKLNRSLPNAASKQIAPEIFAETYGVLIPEMLGKYKMKMMGFPRAEADDVIAVLHNKIRREHTDSRVIVMTCDTDLLQLGDEGTTIFDFQLKSLARARLASVMDVYVVWKIINGDDSDNIPAIDKKIGKVTASKLAHDSVLLEKKLASNPVVRANYERNDTLINFERIPVEMRRGIEMLIA